MWLLLTIALPLTQAVVHRLALVPSAVIRPPEQRRRSAKPTPRSPARPGGRLVRKNGARQDANPSRTRQQRRRYADSNPGSWRRMTDKATSDLWWKNAVIYCADVATWADSDGDGVDDLAG